MALEEKRAFKFRIYPKKKQIKRLHNQLDLCMKLHNILLEKCKQSYKCNKISLCSRHELNKILKELKSSNKEFRTVYSQVLQDVRDRLLDAFYNFFRRLKGRKHGRKVKAGFPRFRKFYKSICYPQNKGSFFLTENNKLHVAKIGNFPIVLHRELEGEIKTLTIKRTRSGNWHVIFICTLPKADIAHSEKKGIIGLDLGIENFAALSNGTLVENPKYLIKSSRKLGVLQRRVSRKKPGSKNRRKAVRKVARMHEHISNQRHDFLHKVTRNLVDHYSFIAIEDLRISNMLRNHKLARSISDASWNSFMQMLCYKAESAGSEVICIDPRNTSQECSNCGMHVQKDLSVRMHECPCCGISINRDVNAAINILKRATAGRAGSQACLDSASTFSLREEASGIHEAGTKSYK